MQQSETTHVVQASINEGKLFDSMKHLFASNTSIIGELMQNARRAHATKVEFELDLGAETLTVSDDGQGIEDFTKLIALCDSGWDEVVAAQDNPFGMGVFSYFFAAHTVTFKSKGQMIRLTHNDIKNKLPIKVTVGDVVNGTTVILGGLDKALLSTDSREPSVKSTKLYEQSKKNALGFPIQVIFNGEALERSLSVGKSLEFFKTSIGFLSMPGFTHDIDSTIGDKMPRLFLQGLPIGDEYHRETRSVLHLDPQKFVARMPDRSELFNADEQKKLITDEVERMIREFLSARKACLDPRTFVEKHWDNCRRWGCSDLLIDIDFVPASIVENLVAIRASEYIRHNYRENKVGTLSRQDFTDGKVLVWIDAPGVDEGNRAVLARWFMLEKEISDINSRGLPANHWIFDLLPSVKDIDFTWSVQDAQDPKVPTFYTGGGSCELFSAGSVDVTATWVIAGQEQKLHHQSNSGWVMVPTTAEQGLARDDTWDDLNVKCYVIDRSDLTHTEPWDVFSDFTDEHDHYMEDWRDDAQEHWGVLMAQIFQEGLHTMVERTLRQNLCSLSEHYDNQFCLVIKPGEGESKDFLKALDLGQDAFWTSIEKLILEQEVDGLKDAFQKAVQAAMAEQQT